MKAVMWMLKPSVFFDNNELVTTHSYIHMPEAAIVFDREKSFEIEFLYDSVLNHFGKRNVFSHLGIVVTMPSDLQVTTLSFPDSMTPIHALGEICKVINHERPRETLMVLIQQIKASGWERIRSKLPGQ